MQVQLADKLLYKWYRVCHAHKQTNERTNKWTNELMNEIPYNIYTLTICIVEHWMDA